eukprot:9734340-Alexandrium_andersonii.AAC.1
MAAKRNWKSTKSVAYWETLKSEPTVRKDNQGPSWSRLRCQIPANLVGEEKAHSGEGTTESKTFEL